MGKGKNIIGALKTRYDKRYNKYMIEMKIYFDDNILPDKICAFLNKRNLQKSAFTRQAIINEIKRTLEKERQEAAAREGANNNGTLTPAG